MCSNLIYSNLISSTLISSPHFFSSFSLFCSQPTFSIPKDRTPTAKQPPKLPPKIALPDKDKDKDTPAIMPKKMTPKNSAPAVAPENFTLSRAVFETKIFSEHGTLSFL